MKILIECSCNVPYELECEPVDGKLDGSVACPTCGADGTELANQIIAKQMPASDTAGEESAMPTSCFRHPDAPLAAFCFNCKKPICEHCLVQHGYFCSAYCLGEAERKGMDIPVYEKQLGIVSTKKAKRVKLIGFAITSGVLALLGAWMWYLFVGSRPRVMFTVDLGIDPVVGYCKFVGPHTALLQSGDRLRLFDVTAGKELWSASLAGLSAPPEMGEEMADAVKEAQSKANNPAEMAEVMKRLARSQAWRGFATMASKVHVQSGNVWVAMTDVVARFDLQTGKQTGTIPINGTMRSASFGDEALTMIAQTKEDLEVVTRVAFADGKVTSQEVPIAPAELWTDPSTANENDFDSMADRVTLEKVRSELVASGSGAVHLDVRLAKPNVVTVATIKPQAAGTGLAGEVSAGNQAAAIEDVLNEMTRQRGGGTRKEDQSQYTVTLRRVPDDGTAAWTGDVTGRPSLFPFKTVDVLVAGTAMTVFDKKNNKLWDTKLPNPIAENFSSPSDFAGDADEPPTPGLETGDTLYFFDKGALRAYDVRTGNVKWTLPSVGIGGLAPDGTGKLYVSTTSAGPESMQYSSQISIRDKVVPVILRVDAASGQILWRAEKLADECYPAGKFLYFVRRHMSAFGAMSMLTGSSSEPTVHFYVDRINPRTGKVVWEYYWPEPALQVDFQDNLILLLFHGRLEALRYLTL